MTSVCVPLAFGGEHLFPLCSFGGTDSAPVVVLSAQGEPNVQNVFKKELSPEEERDEIRDALGADGLVDPRTGGWWPSDELAVSMLPEVFYGDFWDQLVSKPTRVKRVVFLRNGEHLVFQGMRGRMARCAYTADPDLMPKLLEIGVPVDVEPNTWQYSLGSAFGVAVAPFFALLTVFRLYNAWQAQKKLKKNDDLGNYKPRDIKGAVSGVSMNDVAGIDDVRQEIEEIIEFLRNPDRFKELGAAVPKGVLLCGPPGCGKTLLARAVAGEALCKFFLVSGSEFQEMFVGVGASRVRSLFEQAREQKPCIIFIDEFDALGKARGGGSGNAGYSGGGSEAENTINQLLSEMDGFADNSGVVVLAATNRPAVLDPALTRPGRFDRIVRMPPPNREGRVEIIKVHLRGKELEDDLDLQRVARRTAGYSGAELAAVVNDAAFEAVRLAAEEEDLRGESSGAVSKGGKLHAPITDKLLNAAVDKTLEGQSQGTISTSMPHYRRDAISARDMRAVCVYTAGRLLLTALIPCYEEVARVSIVPSRTSDLGVGFTIPDEERTQAGAVSRQYAEAQLTVLMAGFAAELLIYGENGVTTASANAMQTATRLASQMVMRWGWSPIVGPVSYMGSQTTEAYLSSDASDEMEFLSLTAEESIICAQEIDRILREAEERATAAIEGNRAAYDALVQHLLDHEEVDGGTLYDLMEKHGAQPLTDWGDMSTLELEEDGSGRLKPKVVDALQASKDGTLKYEYPYAEALKRVVRFNMETIGKPSRLPALLRASPLTDPLSSMVSVMGVEKPVDALSREELNGVPELEEWYRSVQQEAEEDEAAYPSKIYYPTAPRHPFDEWDAVMAERAAEREAMAEMVRTGKRPQPPGAGAGESGGSSSGSGSSE